MKVINKMMTKSKQKSNLPKNKVLNNNKKLNLNYQKPSNN